MLFCSAIIGFLCVQAPIGGVTNVKLEDGGIWVANTVEAKNWTAHWGRSTEWAPPRIDPSRLAKACEGEVCVSYWRKCSPAFACDVVFDEGHGAAFSLHVEAKAQAGLDEALRSLGIVMQWKPLTAVPLSAMNVEGKGEPPTCAAEPREGPPEGCAKGD